jgi:hypothetical protein
MPQVPDRCIRVQSVATRNAERPTPAPNYLLSRVEQGTDGIERCQLANRSAS